MPKIIIYRSGTNLCVVHPAPGVKIERAMQDVPEGVEAQVVDSETLPSDRYFRQAWEFDAVAGVKVNVEKAKEVQRDVWRKLRAPRLAELDTQVIRAVERGDAKRRTELSAIKQSLRDVTEIELPDDLESIRNTIPEILLP
jgi:hypothetical protein